MRSVWCWLLVVLVLAMRAATMPQGDKVPASEKPGFGSQPSIGRPFSTPSVPKPESAFEPKLNGQRLGFPFNIGAQLPTSSRPTMPTARPVFTPYSPAPTTPKPATETNPLDTRNIINTPCTGYCMAKMNGKCEVDASCLFG